MSDYVVERVMLEASVTCVGCGRELKEKESLDGHAVRTGNHTQAAGYWLDQMRARVLDRARKRAWSADDRKAGYRCAHCYAVDTDPLGATVTPEKSPADVK